MNRDEISVLNLLMIMMKKWWVILCFVIVFFIGSYGYTKLVITPVYTATGSLLISAEDNPYTTASSLANYNDILYARELVNNYVEILSSNTFFKNVAAECTLDYTFREINSMVRVSSKTDTQVLVVRCTNPNPEHAAIIVETVLNNAQSEVARVVSGGGVSIVDHPEVPTSTSAPNTKRNVTIFSLMGFVLGAALVIIIALMDDRVKDSISLKDKFNVPVLAELPVFEIALEPNVSAVEYKS